LVASIARALSVVASAAVIAVGRTIAETSGGDARVGETVEVVRAQGDPCTRIVKVRAPCHVSTIEHKIGPIQTTLAAEGSDASLTSKITAKIRGHYGIWCIDRKSRKRHRCLNSARLKFDMQARLSVRGSYVDALGNRKLILGAIRTSPASIAFAYPASPAISISGTSVGACCVQALRQVALVPKAVQLFVEASARIGEVHASGHVAPRAFGDVIKT